MGKRDIKIINIKWESFKKPRDLARVGAMYCFKLCEKCQN